MVFGEPPPARRSENTGCSYLSSGESALSLTILPPSYRLSYMKNPSYALLNETELCHYPPPPSVFHTHTPKNHLKEWFLKGKTFLSEHEVSSRKRAFCSVAVYVRDLQRTRKGIRSLAALKLEFHNCQNLPKI